MVQLIKGNNKYKEEFIMTFNISVKQKLGAAPGQESELMLCTNISPDGSFEAQGLGFAKTQGNAFVRSWAEGKGLKIRSQKEWVRNAKTKNFEKTIMVQNGASPETYIFVLTQE